MRIAIFTDTYLPDKNGVTASVDHFSRLMADDGHQIIIFCPKGNHYKDKKYPNIIIRRYVSITAPSYKDMQLALPFVWTAVRDLKKFNPDVVHIQTPLGIGWIGIWATKILKIKNIQTYHTYIPDFLVYLSPKTLLGINKITDYINVSSSKLFKTLANVDVIEENRVAEKFIARLAQISKEIFDKDDRSSKINDRFGRDFTRVVYNRADLVLTPSEAMKKVLKKQGVKTRVEVLSNGIDYDYFKKKTDYHIKNKLVHIGRLGYEKNVDVVIKAFDIARQSNSKMTLDIFGFGPAEKSLRDLVEIVGLSEKIKFHGAYDISKLSQKLCDYDCFAIASTVETQGIVILEAMAAGLPIIGVNKLAIPDAVKDGENGYLSKPNDPRGMAKNMLRILESDEKLRQFGQESLKIAKSHEIVKCKERLLDIYTEISKK